MWTTEVSRKTTATKEEIWKDIPGYEGLYKVSNLGNVKSLERIEEIKKLKFNRNAK